MQVAFKNRPGTIPTGAPQAGANDFTDEQFKYELMWTGGMHIPAPEQAKAYEKFGLIHNGLTPTIRKCPIDINHNDGTGARWYIDHKNFRTLGMMERELGLDAGSVMEAWNYGRPDKPLAEKYECPECAFVCGNETALAIHTKHSHGDKPRDEAAEVLGPNPQCAAITSTGARCNKEAKPGSEYCQLPAHQAKATQVAGATTS
jgi:hypothetical protein